MSYLKLKFANKYGLKICNNPFLNHRSVQFIKHYITNVFIKMAFLQKDEEDLMRHVKKKDTKLNHAMDNGHLCSFHIFKT